jgi:hypothetical protein
VTSSFKTIYDNKLNIEDITKGLINEYIQQPETIILAVVPANTDPAGSDALKMAKLADKDVCILNLTPYLV